MTLIGVAAGAPEPTTPRGISKVQIDTSEVSSDSMCWSRLEALWQSWQWRAVIRLLSIFAYIAIGVGYYRKTEGWTTVQCMYFSMVTMSTVGYGDFTPSSAGSQVFTVFYTLVGIVIIFTHVAALTQSMTQPCFNALRVAVERLSPPEGFDVDGNGVADYYVPPHPLIFYTSRLIGPLIAVLLLQLGGAACFVAVEGWDYGTAVYHCMITATTSGYGDVTIETESGRMLAFWHIALSVCLLTSLLGELELSRVERAALLERQRLVLAKLDSDVWQAVLGGGSSEVDKFGFVFGMLVQLQLVDQKEIELFAKLFDKHDAQRRGKISRGQLVTIASEYQTRASTVHRRRSTFSGRISRISRYTSQRFTSRGTLEKNAIRTPVPEEVEEVDLQSDQPQRA